MFFFSKSIIVGKKSLFNSWYSTWQINQADKMAVATNTPVVSTPTLR